MDSFDPEEALRALHTLTVDLAQSGPVLSNQDRFYLSQFFVANPIAQIFSVESVLTEGPGNPNGPAARAAPGDRRALDYLREVLDNVEGVTNKYNEAAELFQLLSSPHMRTLAEVYDDATMKNYMPEVTAFMKSAPSSGLLDTSVVSGGTTLTPRKQQNATLNMALPPGEATFAATSRLALGAEPGLGAEAEGAGEAEGGASGEEVRIIGVNRYGDEPLGITVTKRPSIVMPQMGGGGTPSKKQYDIVIERILVGSAAEKQGMLKVGDIIKEVNGYPVDSPEALQRILKTSGDMVTFKVIPGYREQNALTQVYLRAHFNYDPATDNLSPCKGAGLKFNAGDILQVVSQDDPTWWQARKVNDPEGSAGLIPSQALEERRKAFNKPDDFDHVSYSIFSLSLKATKKKTKKKYLASRSEEFDRNDLVIYEEVARMPAFKRKTLVLVGAAGVGRRTMKEMLVRQMPDEYAFPLPHTSREPREGEQNGVQYWFSSKAELESEVRRHQFLEWGEITTGIEKHIYGTKIQSVRDIIAGGKTAVIDASPPALKFLRDREFMPLVVFIAAPALDVMRGMYELGRSMGLTRKIRREEDFRKTIEESSRLERQYRHMFDVILVNDNMQLCYQELLEEIRISHTEPQWVPVQWVY